MADLYFVSKGNTRIQVIDKKSALQLVSALTTLECTEPLSSSKISGCKDIEDVYEVFFLDMSVRVVGIADAEKVIHWMLTYGCTTVHIEKFCEEEEDKDDDV